MQQAWGTSWCLLPSAQLVTGWALLPKQPCPCVPSQVSGTPGTKRELGRTPFRFRSGTLWLVVVPSRSSLLGAGEGKPCPGATRAPAQRAGDP